jgi:ubiquinone biosynthesis protein
LFLGRIELQIWSSSSMRTGINKRLKSAKRAQEILGVLLKYGFRDVIFETGIDRWIAAGKKLDHALHPEAIVTRLPKAVRLRKAVEELGPTFIKMGQILSTRPDLVDPAIAEEFKQLQAHCPVIPFSKISPLLDREFPEKWHKLFAHIEPEAFASGSLAQVHRAILHDGTPLVLKILKPGVREKIEADMEILSTLAQLVERYFADQGYSPTEVVKEFARQLNREVDLAHEGRATDRFRRYFSSDPRFVFPKVFWHASSRNVLALEELHGTMLSQLRPSDLPGVKLRRLVEHTADSIFKQCFEFGFFHADPHPGNILVKEDMTLAFVDCGMTGHLDKRTSDQLADLLTAVTRGDIDNAVSAVIGLCESDPFKAEDRSFRHDIAEYISIFEDSSLSQLNVGELIDRMFALLRKHRIHCPSDLVFLLKTIATVEGVAESFDPTFDVVDYVRPYLEQLIRNRYSFHALSKRLQKTVISYGALLEVLPETLMGIVAQIRGNRFSVSLEHSGLNRLTDTIDKASQNISFALITAALLVASSLLVGAAPESDNLLYRLGLSGLVVAAILIAILIIANRKGRFR